MARRKNPKQKAVPKNVFKLTMRRYAIEMSDLPLLKKLELLNEVERELMSCLPARK